MSATLKALTAALGDSLGLGQFTIRRFAAELAADGHLPADPPAIVSPQDAAAFLIATAAAPSPSDASGVLAAYSDAPLVCCGTIGPDGGARQYFDPATGWCDPQFNGGEMPSSIAEALAAAIDLSAFGVQVDLSLLRPPAPARAILTITSPAGYVTRIEFCESGAPDASPGFELSAHILPPTFARLAALLHGEEMYIAAAGPLEAGG